MSDGVATTLSGTAQPLLDHIVILVNHDTLTGIDERLAGIFTVAPGGRHADGSTWNRLILFDDGVYIELIAFFDTLDPATRRKHRWGSLPEGTIIDWACSLPHERDFGQIQARVRATQTGYRYSDPVPGGRETDDGTVLKWAIGAATSPDGTPTEPGTLPFWCLDRTPRRLRVPYEDAPSLTSHPSGAKGVSRLVIHSPHGDVASLRAVYRAIYKTDSDDNKSDGWHFNVPSGENSGRQTIWITSGPGSQLIQLALTGGSNSPSFVELLPGLVVKIES